METTILVEMNECSKWNTHINRHTKTHTTDITEYIYLKKNLYDDYIYPKWMMI